MYDGADGRIFENHDVLPRFYATRNVAVEWDMKRFVPRLAATTDWAHVAVLENLPITDDDDARRSHRAARRAGRIRRHHVRASDAYSMRVVAPRHTLIASSIPSWPGWHIRADGKKSRRCASTAPSSDFCFRRATRCSRLVCAVVVPRRRRLSLLTMIALAVSPPEVSNR